MEQIRNGRFRHFEFFTAENCTIAESRESISGGDMIHLYCGDGKGKTTAAVGLAVRAAGNGLKVFFAQFMKGRATGEMNILPEIPGIAVFRADASEKFTFQMDRSERDALRTANDLALRKIMPASSDADLIILDEAVTAVEKDLLDEEVLRTFLEEQGRIKEIILTGRTPESWMVEIADYVTDMEKIRHPYDSGTEARKGIEY